MNASALRPIESETRTSLPTREAALHLSRTSKTLHRWAYEKSGPIQPLRIGGQLSWPVAALRELLGVTAQ